MNMYSSIALFRIQEFLMAKWMKAMVGVRGKSQSEDKMIAWLQTDTCLLEIPHGCQNHLMLEELDQQLLQLLLLEKLLQKRFNQMIRPRKVYGTIIRNL